MPRDPILTRSKAYKDSLNSSEEQESDNEQLDFEHEFDNNEQEFDDEELELDYFNEFEISQNIENSNRLDNFKEPQKIENSNIEMHNSLSQYNEESSSTINENNLPTIRSNRQSLFSEKISTSSLDRHIQAQHVGLYHDFHQTTLNRYLRPTPYPHDIQEKKIDLLNSTFTMIDRALVLCIDLDTLIICYSALHNLQLSNNEWSILSSNYSIIADLRLIISSLHNHLDMFNSTYSDINLVAFGIKEKLDEYWLLMQEASKIAAFFDPHFKKIVYFEQSVDKILAPIRSNLSTNSDNIIQPLSTSK
ncbi:20404_t:CDS:2 [Gigaspora margarita]|uniref:20404_t:CDS:1 n=1 Tax=Gigaspora margarita TaxID=4874 RepID=A0ABN7VTW5_GIGMA|nr:20404_t:CDS:2 [Gigaspora margarita]